jgi:tripartite-type tricarboxylate transporter receptor subunit TctC
MNNGFVLLIGAALLAVTPVSAVAQDNYPARTIRIIVPAATGGGLAFTLPRLVADKLSERWGHPIVVESRGGAAGNIGAEAVARAEPDGYTLLASPPTALVINQSLYPKLSFDPGAFVPVTVIAAAPFVLVAHPKVPAANVQELIAFARANPAKLTYASGGAGSVPHVTMEWLKILGEAPILHVPYKGMSPATNDLLSGQVDLMFDNLGNSLPRIESGSVKALAVASEKRLPSLPQVPAISELFPGFVSDTWFAVVAPPKTPFTVAAQLSAAISDVLRMPDVVTRLQALSARPLGTSPAETETLLKAETKRWRKVIQTAGIKLD